MTKFIGRRGALMLAKETARGTATLTNALAVPYVTISFDDKIASAVESQALGKRAAQDSFFVTQRNGEGEFEAQLYDKALGLVLASLVGSMPVTTGGSPYTQTYTLSQTNQNQSLSILYQDPDTTKLFPLGVVDAVTMKIDQNGIVNWTVGFKSRYGRDWAVQTPTYTSLGSKFLHQHLQFRLATNIAGLAGATEVPLKSLELKISNNTMFDSYLGTVEPADILSNQFSVTGTVELNKTDETYRNYMLNNTYSAAEIKLVGSASSSLQVQFPRLSFDSWEQDRKLDDIVSQKINFAGNYDAVNGLDIISTLVLTNLQASY